MLANKIILPVANTQAKSEQTKDVVTKNQSDNSSDQDFDRLMQQSRAQQEHRQNTNRQEQLQRSTEQQNHQQKQQRLTEQKNADVRQNEQAISDVKQAEQKQQAQARESRQADENKLEQKNKNSDHSSNKAENKAPEKETNSPKDCREDHPIKSKSEKLDSESNPASSKLDTKPDEITELNLVNEISKNAELFAKSAELDSKNSQTVDLLDSQIDDKPAKLEADNKDVDTSWLDMVMQIVGDSKLESKEQIDDNSQLISELLQGNDKQNSSEDNLKTNQLLTELELITKNQNSSEMDAKIAALNALLDSEQKAEPLNSISNKALSETEQPLEQMLDKAQAADIKNEAVVSAESMKPDLFAHSSLQAQFAQNQHGLEKLNSELSVKEQVQANLKASQQIEQSNLQSKLNQSIQPQQNALINFGQNMMTDENKIKAALGIDQNQSAFSQQFKLSSEESLADLSQLNPDVKPDKLSSDQTEMKLASLLGSQLDLQVPKSADSAAKPETVEVAGVQIDRTLQLPKLENIAQVKSEVMIRENILFNKQELASHMQQQVGLMMARNMKSVDIRLDPPELGAIQVRLSVQNEQAAVSFVVSSQQAKDALEGSIPKLREMLEQQGMQLSDSDVQQQDSKQQEQMNGEDGQGANGQRGIVNGELSEDETLAQDRINQSINSPWNVSLYA